METVKCPKCEAEQEIYVNDEGRAVCAFCGEEITDLPEGFNPEEHKRVIPENTDIIEEEKEEGKGEPITADYALTQEDVKTGLYDTGRISRNKTMAIVETVLVAAFFGIEIFNIISEGVKSISAMQVIIMIVMALLIPFIWLMPGIYEKKYIKSIADGTILHARIYEDVIYIDVDGAEKSTVVKLDKTSVLFDTEKRFFLVIPNGSVIILPKEHFTINLKELSDRLKAGTLDKLPDDRKKKR